MELLWRNDCNDAISSSPCGGAADSSTAAVSSGLFGGSSGGWVTGNENNPVFSKKTGPREVESHKNESQLVTEVPGGVSTEVPGGVSTGNRLAVDIDDLPMDALCTSLESRVASASGAT